VEKGFTLNDSTCDLNLMRLTRLSMSWKVWMVGLRQVNILLETQT
jgi:hypothetical protein